ncbi:hypothetical protein [Synechococcus sp. PROS-7-1]|uniref:hypothetical protein n=1 Tax=Synechococcus sp. PROS-7-1 TaxID=1442556 RepID=UPI001CA3A7E2|nr:hypothetical protein [Synechococcus sp. PROS-7-1]
MDLIAQTLESNFVQLQPASIHGVFWLQCHFPKKEWDILIAGQAAFATECMHQLAHDARVAGVTLEWTTSIHSR